MSKVVASVLSLTALTVSILARIDPWTSFVRALAAFALGHVLGAAWEALAKKDRPRELAQEPAPAEEPTVEAA